LLGGGHNDLAYYQVPGLTLKDRHLDSWGELTAIDRMVLGNRGLGIEIEVGGHSLDSFVNADLILTLNGLDAAKQPLEIESKDNLVQFASQIAEINLNSLNSCINSNKYDSMINADLLQAMAYNFAGTPAFIVVKSDGTEPEIIGGAYPFPLFKSVIEKKLAGD